MSKIRILSEHLANQIAAGEVIERPASVVKELLENAIDAAADRVAVQVEGDGTRLLRVIDNGAGMDRDDVLLCLERHATSKLTAALPDDTKLAAIKTLGFRGEALPAIASVAKLSITSRPGAELLGTRVETRYGKVLSVQETGCAAGTVMEVRDLFGNLPARKKFLKTARTELAHIEEVIKNYGLANPHLGITCSVNDKEIVNLPAGTDTLILRMKRIIGQPDHNLIPVNSQAATIAAAGGGITFAGFLLPPAETAGAARLRLFVNGRAVRDRLIAHAVTEGLAGFLMKGRAPAGALFLVLPPAAVDVNVHPAKHEVRFQRAADIHRLVVTAVRQAMERHQHELKFALFGAPKKNSAAMPPLSQTKDRQTAGSATAGSLADSGPAALAYRELPVEDDLAGNRTGEVRPVYRKTEDRRQKTEESGPSATQLLDQYSASLCTLNPEPCTLHPASSIQHPASGIRLATQPPVSLTPLGQLFNLYIICEGTSGPEHFLAVIDQHAAHERLIFENLKKQFSAGALASQMLMFPKLLEIEAGRMAILEKHRPEIEKLGIRLEEFGGDSYLIKAVPAILAHLPPEDILTDILDRYAPSPDLAPAARPAAAMDGIIATMACKAAIKAGHSLPPEGIEALLRQMREGEVFSHCPHGRPVVKIFTAADIEKWFLRT